MRHTELNCLTYNIISLKALLETVKTYYSTVFLFENILLILAYLLPQEGLFD